MSTQPLKVITAAVCPFCASRNTARGGYVKELRGSKWKCRSETCGKEFVVPTLVFRKSP